MITTEKKKNIIENITKEFNLNPKDTGSAEIQVAILNERIAELNLHFKTHKKDHSSKRGLLKLVNQRKKFLEYLKQSNLEKYRQLIQKLGLRK